MNHYKRFYKHYLFVGAVFFLIIFFPILIIPIMAVVGYYEYKHKG